MKLLYILLNMIFISLSVTILATEGPVASYGDNKSAAHSKSHIVPGLSTRVHNPPNSSKVISGEQVTGNEEILERTQRYVKGGLLFSDALLKAMKEVQIEKETPMEKKLKALGCLGWEDISITPHLLQTIETMYDPKRGPFLLAPGLRIKYLNDIY